MSVAAHSPDRHTAAKQHYKQLQYQSMTSTTTHGSSHDTSGLGLVQPTQSPYLTATPSSRSPAGTMMCQWPLTVLTGTLPPSSASYRVNSSTLCRPLEHDAYP